MTLCALGAIPCGIACVSDPVDPTIDARSAEIVDNLLSAGFPEERIEVRDGAVWVDTDARVTLEASRELADDADGFRQYATTNKVSDAIGNICVDGTNATGRRVAALTDAIASYNEQGLSFSLQEVGAEQAGCDAVITVYEDNSTGGSAGFPAGGLPYDAITVGTGLESFSDEVNRHVIMHELGHCIGFRHSDWYDRRISCGGHGPAWLFNEGDAGVGAEHIAGTPTDAEFDGSVMNACFHSGSTGVWTDTDVSALQQLYGLCIPAPEICDDGTDNDCDGDFDCDDADCAAEPVCVPPPVEICDDGVDNDGDGDVDCGDADCSADPACAPSCGASGDPCQTGGDCCSGGCPKGGPHAHTCN